MLLFVALSVGLCGAVLPPTIVWNNWINANFISTAYTSAPEAREFALYVTAAHDGLNSVHGNGRRKYAPYVAYVDNEIHNNASDSVIVAASYRFLVKKTVTTRVTPDALNYYFPLTGPLNQSYYLALVDTFYASYIAGLDPQPNPSQITKGEALGEAAATSVWNARALDGFNRTVPSPYLPTFQAGKWYARPNEPLVYPLLSFQIPISVRTCYENLVNPPFFNLDDSDYLADVLYTKDKGGKFNSTRTAAESNSATFAAILQGPRFQTAFLTQIYPQTVTYAGYDLRDFTRLHALVSMSTGDAYGCVLAQKSHYNFWRPWQAITRAAEYGNLYPKLAALADPTWQPFLTTPPNPEYPAGHPTSSSCMAQTLRRTLGWNVFPGGLVTVVANAAVNESYLTVGELEEKMVNARVFGGMHLRSSGRVGVALGHKLVDWTVDHYLQPVVDTDTFTD
jgi:hypothetical protein